MIFSNKPAALSAEIIREAAEFFKDPRPERLANLEKICRNRALKEEPAASPLKNKNFQARIQELWGAAAAEMLSAVEESRRFSAEIDAAMAEMAEGISRAVSDLSKNRLADALGLASQIEALSREARRLSLEGQTVIKGLKSREIYARFSRTAGALARIAECLAQKY